MRVQHQALSPTVEDSEEADFGSKVLAIGGDGFQGFGGGAEENVVNRFFVLIGNRANFVRYGEHHVEVRAVQ